MPIRIVAISVLFVFSGLLLVANSSSAATTEITPAIQTKLDAMTKEIGAWAADPVIVEAVKTHNKGLSAEFTDMTQEQWTTLPVTNHLLFSLSHNAAADALKAKRTDLVTEAFLSGADGIKVAFLAKTTYWCHKGKPKHDVPMSGKTWQGKIELDESTGYSQIQISVPVLDSGKPIGSLVVGLSIDKLATQ